MSDMSDIQAKIGLVGKSASRHLDTLRAQLFRECQTLFELATKPCSVVFDAFREDNYTEGTYLHLIYFAHRIQQTIPKLRIRILQSWCFTSFACLFTVFHFQLKCKTICISY